MTRTIKLPEDLGHEGYVRVLKRIGEGMLAFTFLAHVNYQGSLRRAYLKFYDTATQPMAPLNELLGYLFAQAMRLPTPEAFIVDVPSSDLIPYGLRTSEPFLRAIGSIEAHDPSVAGEGTAKSLFASGAINLPQIRDRLLKSPSGRTLLAFDEVVGNPDRNIGNIIFSTNHGVVAIDHGAILSGPAWTSSTLNSTQPCGNVIFDIVNAMPLSASEKDALQAAAEVLIEAYYESMLGLSAAIDYRSDRDTSAAFDYVWWRVLGLKIRMATLLGLVT